MREYLLDVSRLVWRTWRGGIPTGVDRVCLAYVKHFGSRSQAVVQRKGLQFVLSPRQSDRLFGLLLAAKPARRHEFVRFWAAAAPIGLARRPRRGAIYLNVGHTGLNEASLPAWIARHRLRAVYLVHDLIPLTHPQFCRDGEAEKHRARMENVLTSAAGIIGNSRATLDDLAEFARDQQLAMPPSIAAWITGSAHPSEHQPRNHSRPHFIAVGTIEGRKNHQLLLDVWRKLVADLGQDTPDLLMVGRRGWKADHVFDQLDDLGELKGKVHELGACNDEELSDWMRGARALLMPSFAEGFGLPVVEALQVGTPVIASDLPVFREIAGDIPNYLDASDAQGWERLIRVFIGDSPERSRQLTRMRNYRAPGWSDHFSTVERWLTSLSRR
jgi:glycosyltransferase involved in cell wall biosynthesis